jgi:hypothetical protein
MGCTNVLICLATTHVILQMEPVWWIMLWCRRVSWTKFYILK